MKIERVNVETSLEVVQEHVTGSVYVGSWMGWKLHDRAVGFGSILHGPGEPEEAAEPLVRLPRRHVLAIEVSYVQNPPWIVLLHPIHHQLRRLDALLRLRVSRMGRGGSRSGDDAYQQQEVEKKGMKRPRGSGNHGVRGEIDQ